MTLIGREFSCISVSNLGVSDLKALSAPWDMPPYSWKSREGDQASLGGWPDVVVPSKLRCRPRKIVK